MEKGAVIAWEAKSLSSQAIIICVASWGMNQICLKSCKIMDILFMIYVKLMLIRSCVIQISFKMSEGDLLLTISMSYFLKSAHSILNSQE